MSEGRRQVECEGLVIKKKKQQQPKKQCFRQLLFALMFAKWQKCHQVWVRVLKSLMRLHLYLSAFLLLVWFCLDVSKG